MIVKINIKINVSAIIKRDGEILLGKKAEGQKPYPDVWHTLGGSVGNVKKALALIEIGQYDDLYFHGELKKRLKEETGISIKNIRNICPMFRERPRETMARDKKGAETHYYFLEYLCDYDSGELSVGGDNAKLKWVTYLELKYIPLTPPSQAMYSELGWI